MLVFIDESGDAGLKLQAGSTNYFVVTLVVFDDHEEALNVDRRVDLLRQEMGIPKEFEFHFSKLNRERREAFLYAMRGFDFYYFSIVINKSQLHGPGFRYKESFYKYACSLVFDNAKYCLEDATVIIDGSGTREFRNQLKAYLRRKMTSLQSDRRHIKKLKIQDSVKNNLLQLADMISGAVARSYSNKSDAWCYRACLSQRERYVQLWPKGKSRP
jgi:hypothetical protein